MTIGDATAGTTIYYTTNGTTPTTSSTKYTGAITVSATETLEAIAVETGYTNSPAATATYTINGALAGGGTNFNINALEYFGNRGAGRLCSLCSYGNPAASGNYVSDRSQPFSQRIARGRDL